jgi:hypothetical protein
MNKNVPGILGHIGKHFEHILRAHSDRRIRTEIPNLLGFCLRHNLKARKRKRMSKMKQTRKELPLEVEQTL